MTKKLNKFFLPIIALPLISIVSCKTKSQEEIKNSPIFSSDNQNLQFNNEQNKYLVKITGTNLIDDKTAYKLTLNSGEENLLDNNNSNWILSVNENKTELTLMYNGSNLVTGIYSLLAVASNSIIKISTPNPTFTIEQNSLKLERVGNENKYTVTFQEQI